MRNSLRRSRKLRRGMVRRIRRGSYNPIRGKRLIRGWGSRKSFRR